MIASFSPCCDNDLVCMLDVSAPEMTTAQSGLRFSFWLMLGLSDGPYSVDVEGEVCFGPKPAKGQQLLCACIRTFPRKHAAQPLHITHIITSTREACRGDWTIVRGAVPVCIAMCSHTCPCPSKHSACACSWLWQKEGSCLPNSGES